MKYRIFPFLLILFLVAIFVIGLKPTDTQAQYSNICNDPDIAEIDLIGCEEEYDLCNANPLVLETENLDEYAKCTGNEGCNAINRYKSYDEPSDCVNWEEY